MSTPRLAPAASCLALLDRPLPIFVRVALLAICAFLPTAYVVMEYEQHHDLTRILSFGDLFQARELAEIRQMDPAIVNGPGFDGQFYAQIALDPTFHRPDLPGALDNPSLRGQRIFLPALAHVLGLGQPQAVINIYAILNLAFWFLLFFVLIYQLPADRLRSFLVLFAIMWSGGTLLSVESALTDLPMAALGLLSLNLGEFSAAILISLAILTKPTGGLFLLRYASPFPRSFGDLAKKSAMILMALVLPVLWQLYLFHRLKTNTLGGDGLLGLPFAGWWHRLGTSTWTLAESATPWSSGDALSWVIDLFEVLALISSTVQAAFLLCHPRWRQSIWIVGIAFAFLFFCLSDKVFASQAGYARAVLPMMIAFNLLLLEIKPAGLFLFLFIAGNIGLMQGVGEMFLYSWFPAIVGG